MRDSVSGQGAVQQPCRTAVVQDPATASSATHARAGAAGIPCQRTALNSNRAGTIDAAPVGVAAIRRSSADPGDAGTSTNAVTGNEAIGQCGCRGIVQSAARAGRADRGDSGRGSVGQGGVTNQH